jgi:DNA-binding protein H-NS
MLLEGLTIKQLDALALAVAEKRQQLVFADRKRVRQLLIDAATAEGFTIEGLFGFGAPGQPEQAKKQRLATGIYRNPANPSQVWHGRGPRPNWLKRALAAGTPAVALRIDS